MSRSTTVLAILLVAAASSASAGEKKIQMTDLPPAVRTAVEAQTKGDTVKGLSTEVENGKRFYEAETLRNGRSRDLLFDATGAVVEVEEAIDPASAPEAVRTALAARGGKLLALETVTKGSTVTYEARVRKNGKTSEAKLDANGKAIK